jgi:hypothetical protein
MSKFPCMKRFGLPEILFVGLTFVLGACASRQEVISEDSSLQSTAPVAGEKIPGEPGFVPGGAPGRAGGNVRW